MPADITIPPALIGLLVIVAILWLANEWVAARRRRGPWRFDRLRGPLPFRMRADFLSPAELSAYHLLAAGVAGAYVILAKVSLGDLFFVPGGDQSFRLSWRNRIDRKHVDFLLCDPATLCPLLGVELDDQSHQRADRKMRDDLVDSVFAVAGLPLLRIPVSATYHTGELRAAITAALGADERPDAAPVGPRHADAGSAGEAGPPLAVQRMATERGGATADLLVGTAAAVASPDADEPAEATTSPACPQCGEPMVRRTATRGRHAGSVFWGCRNYPRCRAMLPVPEGR